jgi:hypothetical protein
VSIDTTNVYAEVDLEMKAAALSKCDIGGDHIPGRRRSPALLEFLRNLS